MDEAIILQKETQSWKEQRIKPKSTEELNLSSTDIVLCRNLGLPMSDVINIMSLNTALKKVSQLSDSEILSALKSYADVGLLNLLKNLFTSVELRYLYAILLWLSNSSASYGRIMLDVSLDPETNDFQFVSFIISDCDWTAWKEIARHVKEEMKKTQLDELASKVAIVCLRGLIE